MKNWSSLGVTNILLLIIAVFLLILVVNSSPNSGKTTNPHLTGVGQMGAAPDVTDGPMGNPHDDDQPDDQSMGAPDASQNPHGEFNVQNMAFSALKCVKDATTSLADQNCKDAESNKRREFVTQLASQNLPPRMLFDKIIEKFGEAALTDEAREIRKNNRSR